jgi:hypothetical protein
MLILKLCFFYGLSSGQEKPKKGVFFVFFEREDLPHQKTLPVRDSGRCAGQTIEQGAGRKMEF